MNGEICSSKREAREVITSGSIYVNGDKVDSLEYNVGRENALDNKYIVIRKGKKKYFLGEFIDE